VQRHISLHQIELVWQFGTLYKAGNGNIAYVFDRDAATAADGELADPSNALNIAIVTDGGATVLTAHRVKRLPHHWQRVR